MTFLAILVLGTVAGSLLPVSLMPDIDVPQVTVQVSGKNTSARQLENTVISPLRRQLMQVAHLYAKHLTKIACPIAGVLFFIVNACFYLNLSSHNEAFTGWAKYRTFRKTGKKYSFNKVSSMLPYKYYQKYRFLRMRLRNKINAEAKIVALEIIAMPINVQYENVTEIKDFRKSTNIYIESKLKIEHTLQVITP